MARHNKIVRREKVDAAKVARRRAIENQFPRDSTGRGLKPMELEPTHKVIKGRTVSPLPGYFKRGGLKGVIYGSHIKKAYV